MRYTIWDKKINIITPIGEILTPTQWIERYPVAAVLKTVCSGGEINGGYFGVFSSMVQMYESQGCDFSECKTDQDFLDAIEAFEDSRSQPSDENTAEERIASALETQVLLAMEDVNI